jgi:6-phosphofructokinase 1
MSVPDGQGCVERVKKKLMEELGTPGKWELLFHENGDLIQGRAERLESKCGTANPYLEKARALGKPDTVYVRECEGSGWPTVPALCDWEVIRAFESAGCPDRLPSFYVAGEPREFRLNPAKARIGILVAGGNSAGLNMVVDSIVKRITGLASEIKSDRDFRPNIVGYVGGYVGLKRGDHFEGVQGTRLTIKDTDPRAGDPCIFLKTLRGRRFKSLDSPDARAELDELADAVQRDGLQVLFVIGGNGTFSWANELYKTLKQREYSVALVGGPKTMDWDINFAEATFGFRTAVDNAVEFIRTAHWEAETQDRIAVIELFGAASGYVALHAGFLSGEADYIMIPEFDVSEDEVFAHLEKRLKKRKHAVLVIAEGALKQFQQGQQQEKERAFTDFVARLKGRFPDRGLVDVRPRHLIRGTLPCSFDLDLAKYTGYLMADTALAGFTNCSVQLWQGNYVLVPLPTAVARLGQVQMWSPYFWYMAQRHLLPK